jgi:hypothetical protein
MKVAIQLMALVMAWIGGVMFSLYLLKNGAKPDYGEATLIRNLVIPVAAALALMLVGRKDR